MERLGPRNYEMMLRDCHWHVYAMIGKLHRRACVLSKDYDGEIAALESARRLGKPGGDVDLEGSSTRPSGRRSRPDTRGGRAD